MSSFRRSHRMVSPQKATAVTPRSSANRITRSAISASSATDSNTVPSASHVTRPCTKTPGASAPSRGNSSRAHGPRDFPVATTQGTPRAAARAIAASVDAESVWSDPRSVPSTSVTMRSIAGVEDDEGSDAEGPEGPAA